MCLQLFELFSVSSEGNSSTSSGQFLNCLETVRFEFNLFVTCYLQSVQRYSLFISVTTGGQLYRMALDVHGCSSLTE